MPPASSFAAVTDVIVAELSARQLVAAFEQQPRLGVAFLWAASRDEAMVVEHLVNIGRRSALVRTAHFLVELGLRTAARRPGLGNEPSPARLNQYLLADAVGLTAIHVNRILRQLRERKLLTFRDGHCGVSRSSPPPPASRPPQRLSGPGQRRELMQGVGRRSTEDQLARAVN